MSDFFPILLGILILVVGATYSAKWGLIPIFAIGSATLVATLVFLGVFHNLPKLADMFFDLPLGWKAPTVVGLILAIAVLFISWYPAAKVLRKIFGPDSPLHAIVDGIPAAVLSIVPSVIMIAVLFSCFRIAGTVQELRYVAALSSEETRGEISSYPNAGVWRENIESIPAVSALLDRIDPFSAAPYRNAAAVVLLGRDPSTRSFFARQEETAPVFENSSLLPLNNVETIDSAVTESDHLALVRDPSLREKAEEQPIFPVLENLELRPFLERFVESLTTSPDPGTPSLSN